MSSMELLQQNRVQGARVEQWAADLLRRVHQSVLVVGGAHYPSPVPYDIEADGGMYYEVKACAERVARMGVQSGTQPGRWKVDTLHHAELGPERAERTMYLLVVTDEQGPKAAYLCSHARMSQILVGYARQGQFASVTTSVWTPRLHRMWTRPPGVPCPACGGRIARAAPECRHCKHVLDEDALAQARRDASDMKEAERIAFTGMRP